MLWRSLGLLLSLSCAGGNDAPADSGVAGDSAGADSADPGGLDCTEEQAVYGLTWTNWGAGFFATYCDSCHAADTPDRFGAPEGVSFDTLGEVRDWEQRIRVRVLDEATMPRGGGVYDEDLLLIEAFLDCGL